MCPVPLCAPASVHAARAVCTLLYYDTWNSNEGQRYEAGLPRDVGSRRDGSERRHARTRPADVLSRYFSSLLLRASPPLPALSRPTIVFPLLYVATKPPSLPESPPGTG